MPTRGPPRARGGATRAHIRPTEGLATCWWRPALLADRRGRPHADRVPRRWVLVVGGGPLASRLFDRRPEVDKVTRERLVERVHMRWAAWRAQHAGQPEEYLAYLEGRGGPQRDEAVWYVGLTVALATACVEPVGMRWTITKHNINRTTGIPTHEEFWSCIFRQTSEVVVVTTNYDILAERGLRHEPRPRVPRPGFHYGAGPEALAGGGYPSYAHIKRISAEGRVALLKLHGSVSWSVRAGHLVRYYDCRPALRGDPAIVAPATTKSLAPALVPMWEAAAGALACSGAWVIVGYSLPPYDLLVRDLLRGSSSHHPDVHVFNPDPEAARRCASCMPSATVHCHPGLPEGLTQLDDVMTAIGP